MEEQSVCTGFSEPERVLILQGDECGTEPDGKEEDLVKVEDEDPVGAEREKFRRIAVSHWSRFFTSFDATATDISLAVDAQQKVFDSGRLPDDLHNLAFYRLKLYQIEYNTDDLDSALELSEEVLKATPSDFSDRGSRLAVLAWALFFRYTLLHDSDDLDRAIELQEEALKKMSSGDPGRTSDLRQLARYLSSRYNKDHDDKDMVRLIELQEGVVRNTSSGDTNHTARLDLYRAIELQEELVMKTSAGDPDCTARLHNLADFLSSRYDRDRVADLDRAIEIQEEVEEEVEVTSANDPYRSLHLHTLVNYLTNSFGRSANATELDRAIEVQHEAFGITRVKDPQRSSHGHALAGLLFRKYEHCRDPSLISQAIRFQRDAVDYSNPTDGRRSERTAALERYEEASRTAGNKSQSQKCRAFVVWICGRWEERDRAKEMIGLRGNCTFSVAAHPFPHHVASLDGLLLYLLAPARGGSTSMTASLSAALSHFVGEHGVSPLAVVSTGACAGYWSPGSSVDVRGDLCVAESAISLRGEVMELGVDRVSIGTETSPAQVLGLWQMLFSEAWRYDDWMEQLNGKIRKPPRQLSAEHDASPEEVTDDWRPSTRYGVLESDDVMRSCKDLLEASKQHRHKIIALDRESFAFYQACRNFPGSDGFPSLLVKGISGYADGEQSLEFDVYASQLSALYVHELLLRLWKTRQELGSH